MESDEGARPRLGIPDVLYFAAIVGVAGPRWSSGLASLLIIAGPRSSVGKLIVATLPRRTGAAGTSVA